MYMNHCFFPHQYAYTEEYEQQRGKGSFPAHITPGYKMSKKATEQASDVSNKRKAHPYPCKYHYGVVIDHLNAFFFFFHAEPDQVSSDV